ncbi:hypothetical protein J8273_0610 [Carpediemonas membranifera]|uniref:Uncharacterized protein n=1 Tax=Carpediemonas membranifera TaxID=201153 RepID=A0A8J6EBK3_9EUKA|nr:hypothetical protein J8273_0610 [Carpediemonas membranifera]|eukprot:KAG9397480.1 hypothetical protein J8273_0610 [Carpediemonas membranifera]
MPAPLLPIVPFSGSGTRLLTGPLKTILYSPITLQERLCEVIGCRQFNLNGTETPAHFASLVILLVVFILIGHTLFRLLAFLARPLLARHSTSRAVDRAASQVFGLVVIIMYMAWFVVSINVTTGYGRGDMAESSPELSLHLHAYALALIAFLLITIRTDRSAAAIIFQVIILSCDLALLVAIAAIPSWGPVRELGIMLVVSSLFLVAPVRLKSIFM